MLKVGLTARAEPRAAATESHPTAGPDGSSAVLYGPASEPSPRRNAREGTGASNNPQNGATPTKPHDPRMLTVGTAFGATTSDGLAANVGPMQEPMVFNHAHSRAATRAHARRRDEYADLPLTTPMVAAARCSCSSSMPRPRLEWPCEPSSATRGSRVKQHGATANTKKLQRPE